MTAEIIVAFVAFLALIVAWIMAPPGSPMTEAVAAPAPVEVATA